MLAKLQFLLRHSSWLFALMIITSALPAHAQDDEPYLFDPAEDGSGYIMRPRPYMSYEGVLDVPAVRESNGIPIVGVDGFSYQERLLGIQFYEESQVKYIGSFQGCTGIEFIANMPATVEKIGDYAFQGCERLRDVTLNDGLKYIGISCFEGCTSLESITLPKSLKVIREYAFRNCANFDNWGNFMGGGLESVVFEDGVDFYTNDVYCFYNHVFWGCANLSSVTLPNGTPGRFIIPAGTFGYCGNLKKIEFPTNTGKIEAMAFYRTGLESLDLTKIEWKEPFYLQGYYTFAACENLKTVTAKGKVRFDGLYTFEECTALETVTFTGSGEDYTVMNPDIFKRCSNLKSVKFYRLKGNGQDNDMDSVFTDCTSLVSVTSECPPEISKIGYSCFDGCTSLTTLSLPQTEYLINETAFRGCAALQSLNLANVTSIGTKAFTGCSALTSISLQPLSDALPTMEKEDAFDEWHYANTEIEVPDEKYSVFVTDASWNKFVHIKHPSLFAYDEVTDGYSIRKSQYALDEDFVGMLEIPGQYNSRDVVSIAEGTFQGFTGLTGVTLPEKLTSIGNKAFSGCTNINTIINKGSVPLYGDVCLETVFDNEIYLNGNLYVPFGSLDAYKSFAPWSHFKDRIKQGFGERRFAAPQPSRESGVFNYPFALTLTNPQESGTIYYYIVGEGDVSTDVHTVNAYSDPITIDSTYKVVAYVSDDTSCSEPVSFEYTYEVPEPELSHIVDIQNIPQGTLDVDFTTLGENETLNNVVINNIYYSITDIKSGYNQYGGLVLNKMSSIDDIHQFNRDIKDNPNTYSNFNGIAVKVKGTGSITFNAYANYGNARLTLLLGDGEPVNANDLAGMKYEFSTPSAQYLYIFSSPSEAETETLASLPSLQPAENSVMIVSMKIDIADEYVATENGLDKVLTASADESYRINTALYGHYFDGTYLYASTMGNSGSAKNTFNEDKKSEPESDNESNFNQEDWVAISGLTSDYVGKKIESGNAANVISNTSFPVIKFPEGINPTTEGSMSINDFRVAHFNIQADNAEVKNIWLVAPQPAEYCSFTGYMSTEKINADEHYFVLQSAEKGASYLTMDVYYDPATLNLSTDGWHCFKGIVSKDGDALKFTALSEADKIPTGIENVDACGTRIFAANGNINVTADTQTSIIVYSASGQLITSFEASNAIIAVTPGFYIVKVGNQVTKLAVK